MPGNGYAFFASGSPDTYGDVLTYQSYSGGMYGTVTADLYLTQAGFNALQSQGGASITLYGNGTPPTGTYYVTVVAYSPSTSPSGPGPGSC